MLFCVQLESEKIQLLKNIPSLKDKFLHALQIVFKITLCL